MNRLCLYYRSEPETNRWLPGDRFVRPIIRRIIRGKPRPGGVDKVFINLCLGLRQLGHPFVINPPFHSIQPSDHVAVLGRGRHCLDGYDRPNPILAGIGLMTHPSEWPDLCTQYPIHKYLQHSAWCDAVYRQWFGDRCDIWPVGIDTEHWNATQEPKTCDFLLYNKVLWEQPRVEVELLEPLRRGLKARGLSHEEIRYGHYQPQDFKRALGRCRAMLFVCEHESQGIACQEALSSGVPVLAWDPGFVLDPERFKWGQPIIPATSVPYFDERCGRRFKNLDAFAGELEQFLCSLSAGSFNPRAYILENLTLEKSARHFIGLLPPH